MEGALTTELPRQPQWSELNISNKEHWLPDICSQVSWTGNDNTLLSNFDSIIFQVVA